MLIVILIFTLYTLHNGLITTQTSERGTNEQIWFKKINNRRSIPGVDDGPVEVISYTHVDDGVINLVSHFVLCHHYLPSLYYTSAKCISARTNAISNIILIFIFIPFITSTACTYFFPLPHPFFLVHVETNILGLLKSRFDAYTIQSLHFLLSFLCGFVTIRRNYCMYVCSFVLPCELWSTINIYISWKRH